MSKQENQPRLSAAHLTVPGKRGTQAKPNLLERLRPIVAESGTNKNDQAIVAITGCITDGVDTAKGIYELLARIGFDTRHVAAIPEG